MKMLLLLILALFLKKSSDSRSRKYKVWNEFYDKIFSGTDIIEPYLLSVLIHRKVSEYLLLNYSSSTDDTTRYLAKNASFHISRISAYLWRTNDNWTNTATLKRDITNFIENNVILDSHINSAMTVLLKIVNGNAKYLSDLNSSLKSADLDREINKELHFEP
ncbi:MAG: hypothetical protein IPH93_05580 [Saprospiraceae bacterium]|nr:hypothetical protein [Saprospiraceae bacterium]